MAHYLLAGAGFTRNWGGPLSSEVNGSLLGDLHDDPVLSKRLREAPFESVFEGFNNPAAKPSERQQRFQDAVVNLFQRLNLALLNKPLVLRPANSGVSGWTAPGTLRCNFLTQPRFTSRMPLPRTLHAHPEVGRSSRSWHAA